ncbi:biotin/lipoyl-binding protein [Lysobacter sp. TY2-98]|uniref:HlyD family secretion protein n=1 Tax=Lysobacter sp. TY2-98 TaxID=2290922 RepID=UPI000E2002FD|nr:biotin/lipoyl-binding protein [Lysobacter sp. TY2-98]AXK71761.1 biotin/lipoyl-binding protein [Lysobacter sp. TY2-98]
MKTLVRLACVAALASAGCSHDNDIALGTLEYDRVTLPAPLSEPIIAINVREGQHVTAGQVLLRFDAQRSRAQVEASVADTERQRAALSELETGPRREQIDQARSRLATAEAQVRDATAYVARLGPLLRRHFITPADYDQAVAARDSAMGAADAARAALDELLHGTRIEQIAQGEAAVAAANAQVAGQRVTLQRLDVTAPRAGIVDSLPFKLGDQPAAGATTAVLLTGDAPYARIYVPAHLRNHMSVGTRVTAYVEGRPPISGRVRMIRNEPVFTPYYALVGDDAARLSWLAEVTLDTKPATGLAAGLPVRVRVDE